MRAVTEDGKMFRFDFAGSPLEESELLCTMLEAGAVIPSFQRRLSVPEEALWEKEPSGILFGAETEEEENEENTSESGV